MSVNQINQHESLTNFEDLPSWYQRFIKELIVLNETTCPKRRDEKNEYLQGYVTALFFSGVINCDAFGYLFDLVFEAWNFAYFKRGVNHV